MIDDSRSGVQDVLTSNLRRLRIARHLSLSELARATGMSKATLSGIENGRANPTLDTLAALAGALRIPVVELLEEAPLGELRVVRAAGGGIEQGDGVPRRLLDAIELAGAVEIVEIALRARQMHESDARADGSRAHVYVSHLRPCPAARVHPDLRCRQAAGARHDHGPHACLLAQGMGSRSRVVPDSSSVTRHT